MACGACIQAAQAAARIYSTPREQEPLELEPCEYNASMLSSWKDKLLCTRTKGIMEQYGLTNEKINSFLGIILSGIHLGNNVCYLRARLDNIKPYIINIINGQQC